MTAHRCSVKGTENHSDDITALYNGNPAPIILCGYHAFRWPVLMPWERYERSETVSPLGEGSPDKEHFEREDNES